CGAGGGVEFNGADKVTGRAVVQEEDSLAHTPQRRGAKFVRCGLALADAVIKSRTHVMQREIRERLERCIAQWTQIAFVGFQAVGMAQHAANACSRCGAARSRNYCPKQCLTMKRRCAQWLTACLTGKEITWNRRRIQAHEDSEVFDKRRYLAGIITRVSARW